MTVTDHSRATADGAHSHGYNGTTVPNASRADRLTSFDPTAFAEPSAREEQWRFSALKDLAPLFDVNAPHGEHLDWNVTELPAGVTVTGIEAADVAARAVRAPGDRAAAVAAASTGASMLMSIAPGTVLAEPVTFEVTGAGQSVRQSVLIEVGANAEATVIVSRKGTATVGEFVSVDLGDNSALNLILLQQWDADAVHAGEVVIRLGRDARLRQSVVTLGGKAVRLNTCSQASGWRR